MQKVDRCEHCRGSHPHVSLQSCPPVIIGGGPFGEIYDWSKIPANFRPDHVRSTEANVLGLSLPEYDEAIVAYVQQGLRGWTQEQINEALAELGTLERDEDFANFLENTRKARAQGLTLEQWQQQEVDKLIAEQHTCTVYCPPECEFKAITEQDDFAATGTDTTYVLTADDRAFRTWHEREFGYRPTQANLNEDDSVFRSAFEAGRRFERGEGRGHDVSDPVSVTHTGMAQHDGYVPHSHEVRSDHKGVAKR